jgi:sterol desaturase/sphingolipid hydroxylase (fatty acid hydroxylase superfamily)
MGKTFVSNKDESVRMFESNFMEFFSKVHWSVPLYIYIPLISFMLWLSVEIYHNPKAYIITLFIFGLILWSLAEYALHRFVLHYEPQSQWGRRLHWTIHGVHHDYPMDSKRLVLPPSVSLPLAVLFFFLFRFIFGMYYAPFFAGFVSGYLMYDMTHYALHHHAFRNKLLLKLKTHHMKHHYSQPDQRFGVSIPVWDHVFGTAGKARENIN